MRIACYVAIVLSACGHRDEAPAQLASATPTPEVAPAAPREQAATFTNAVDDKAARDRTDRVMRQVFDRCAGVSHVFSEGSHVEGSHVDAEGKYPELVNVKIELARPDVADGNALWYQVDLTAKPPTITASKDIAATLCGLPTRDQAVPL